MKRGWIDGEDDEVWYDRVDDLCEKDMTSVGLAWRVSETDTLQTGGSQTSARHINIVIMCFQYMLCGNKTHNIIYMTRYVIYLINAYNYSRQ